MRRDGEGVRPEARAAVLPVRAGRVLAVIAACALCASAPFMIVGELPGERWLSARDAHAPAFAAFGTLLLALDVLLPIPSSVIGSMLGGRLGALLGFACCLLGLVAGHGLGYWLGRLAPERWAGRAPSAPSWIGVLSTRPVPVLSEAFAIAAGATRMPWPRFIGATVLGDAIYAAALAATGATLLPAGSYFAALIAPMVLVVIAAWLARRFTRMGAGPQAHGSAETSGH